MAKRQYLKEGLVVLWDSELCIHCHKCADALPTVFRPEERPWVKLDGAPADDIVRVVNDCPSGAISIAEA